MVDLNRKEFLKSASLMAGAASIGTLAGCTTKGDRKETSQRRHPLDGISREDITITDVKVIPLSYVDPDRNLWRVDSRKIWKTDGCITQVFTDRGIVGIGEGSPYAGPAFIKKYTEEQINPILMGKNPFDVEFLTAGGTNSRERRAWAGVDCALWDIIGKAKGKPVYELLATDTEPRTTIPIYASGGVEHEWYENGAEQLIQEALEYKEEGYDCFKFRQGTNWEYSNMTLDKYIPILRRLREAVGPDFKLCHETMGSTGVPMERIVNKFCPALEELGFHWFESAVFGTPVDEMDWYLKCNKAMPTVNVTGGETMSSRYDAQVWLDNNALDIIQSDCNTTGITENWYISQMANLRGITSIPHSWHGGGTTMANAHFTAAIPNGSYCELNQTYNPLKEGIFKEPLTVEDGYMELPDKPGFGVELIDDVEKKFPFEPGSYREPNPVITS